MGQDDKIRNPVEEYMQYLIDRDKPGKLAETTAEPAKHLEVKKTADPISQNNEALKVADAIKQSVNIKKNSEEQASQSEDLQDDLIFDIKRHPFGLATIFISVIVVWAAAFSLVSFLLPGLARLFGLKLSVVGPVVGICMIAVTLFVVLFLSFAAKRYLSSRLMLTDFSLGYSLPLGQSSNKTGEIPLDEIKDVKVYKKSILASIFNYGTLVIETSKGKNGLTFDYAHNPETYAKSIQDSKLRYLAYYKIFNL